MKPKKTPPQKPRRQPTRGVAKPLRKTTTTTTKVISQDGQTVFVKDTAKRAQSKSMEDAAGDKKKITKG